MFKKATLSISAAAITLTLAANLALAKVPAALLENKTGPAIYVDLEHVEPLKATDNVVFVDIRTPDRYAAGHIPGAINIPREQIETPVVAGAIGETKSPEELQVVLSKAGLNYEDRIIVYGEKDEGPLAPTSGRYAAKIYVSLNELGFDKVHVLDGGVEAWKAELSTDATVLPPSNLKLTKAKPVIVDKSYVQEALHRDGTFVLDARGSNGFDEGHIKGSYHVPIGLFSDANTLTGSVDALVARLDELGVKKDSEIITTCGWGWAASDLLAVLRDLGYSNIKLYDGSWTEWVQDPNTPKAGAKFQG